MKKIFSIALLFAASVALLTSCSPKEEDDLFSSSAAERLAASKVTYTERLGGTTWAMEFYPIDSDEYPEGAGYLILNHFFKDGSVDQAMKNDVSDGVFVRDTSLWEVIADMGPVLSFNSYNNCLHTFADPGIYNQGQGFQGDYEFKIIDLDENADFAMLKGKKRGTYVRMTRLPDDTDFEAYINDVQDFQSKIFSATAPNDCLLRVGDTTMVVTNASSGIISMYPYGGDPISETTDHAYMITKHDGKYYFRFREALEFGENSVQELVYDEANDQFVGTEDGGTLIQGWPVGKFFLEYPIMPKSWTLTLEGTMSEKMKAVMETLNNEISQMTDPLDRRKRKLAFKGIGFSNKADKPVWNVIYKLPSSSGNSSQSFNFATSLVDNNVTFNYEEPNDDAAANFLGSCSSVSPLLQVLSQEYVVSAVTTNFNLTKIRLTAISDSNLWFEITL